jgi:hypothetical protein
MVGTTGFEPDQPLISNLSISQDFPLISAGSLLS